MSNYTTIIILLASIFILLANQLIVTVRYTRNLRKIYKLEQKIRHQKQDLEQEQQLLSSVDLQVAWQPQGQGQSANYTKIADINLSQLSQLLIEHPSLRTAINNNRTHITLKKARPIIDLSTHMTYYC